MTKLSAEPVLARTVVRLEKEGPKIFFLQKGRTIHCREEKQKGHHIDSENGEGAPHESSCVDTPLGTGRMKERQTISAKLRRKDGEKNPKKTKKHPEECLRCSDSEPGKRREPATLAAPTEK